MADIEIEPIIVPLLTDPDQQLRAWTFQELVRGPDPQFEGDATIRALDKLVTWIKTGEIPREKSATPRHLKAVETPKA